MIARPTDTHSAEYNSLILLFSNQQKQAAANQKTHDEYLQRAASWISENTQHRAYKLPLTPVPGLPLQTVYEDDGSISTPPFPDLVLPVLPPDVSTGVGPGGFHTTPPGGIPPTEIQSALILLNLICDKLGI